MAGARRIFESIEASIRKMDLVPKLPPGRSNRKAKAFTTEIKRLRAVGYTFEAIRETLLDAGVDVTRATVRREVMKVASPARAARPSWSTGISDGPSGPPHRSVEPRLPATATGSPSASQLLFNNQLSGKEIAEEYSRRQITNPLLREMMRREEHRD